MGRYAVNFLFALTVFFGAFFLFLVQPLIGKYILPWFGGSPAVWTTCMLFFQVALLAGYGYAHASVRYLRPRGQMIVHLALLAVAVAMLPIIPGERWMPQEQRDPMLGILGLLAVSVGLPYFVLAATGPLLQGWFARLRPGESPYRLYALSNAASLLALVGYPFVFEPIFTRPSQAKVWGAGMAGFAAVCAVVAYMAGKAQSPHPNPLPEYRAREKEQGRKLGAILLWLGFPACGSALLLAVTNKICQDVAVVPLLWVLPLAIYLLSFIICFDSPRWYRRGAFVPLMAIAMAAVCWLMFQPDERISIVGQISIYCFALFACCMVCHGELFKLRPEPARLTSFYLMIAAGGAMGGVLVAIGAPLLLNGYFELHIALFAAAVLAFLACRLGASHRRLTLAASAVAIVIAVFGGVLLLDASRVLKDSTILSRIRNFYGVLSVCDVLPGDPVQHHRLLQHGGVTHGLQFVNPSRRGIPTAYYGPASGAGLALRHAPRNSPLRVGLVGLGIGTVAAYGQTGDEYRAYEINPDVVRIARDTFSFLRDSPANVQVILGDARLSLQRESPQQFDLLILDAFSGDAIPVHLLTHECFELYQRHLRPGGIIAVHISNQHLDLAPVVLKLAEHFNLSAAQIISPPDAKNGQYQADWLLVTSDKAWLSSPPIRTASTPVRPHASALRLWTDDDTNLFQILN